MMKKSFVAILGVLSALGYGWMGYGLVRTQTGELLLSFGTVFLCYGLIISQKWSDQTLKKWLWASIFFRFIFLFSTPTLSDDYARFVWDGRLLSAGYNPYLYLPTQILNEPWASAIGLTPTLFEQLNSPQYFTVYPPLNQMIFAMTTWLSGGDFGFNLVFLRIVIILAEIGTMLYLLPSLSAKIFPHSPRYKASLVYGLNPLVIAELTGNLHFEAVTLFFILSTVLLFYQKRPHLSAIALAAGAGVKLLPLIFVPLLAYRLGGLRAVRYMVIVGATTAVVWWPFFSLDLGQNVWKSLDLYFQKFEFNASFYYLFRQVGYWLKGYNIIETLGPLLSFLSLGGIIWLATKHGLLSQKMLLTLTLYFLLATTVHPWYITTLVALGALTHRWYPVVWSALLPLTYVAYGAVPYQENLWLLWVEYLIVLGVLIYEQQREESQQYNS